MIDLTRVLLVGDIELGGDFAAQYCGPGRDCAEPLSAVQSLFLDADLRIGNLESPLGRGSVSRPKRNRLGASADAVRALDFLQFTGLNLANNHITDQGREALTRTRQLLNRHGIACFGAGEDQVTASLAGFNRHGGRTFGFLGYAMSDGDVHAEIASDSAFGCAPLLIDQVERDISALKKEVSHVVVSIHWGYQYEQLPSPQQVEMAHRIIDAGAVIVHGHHPHVLQGIERYEGGLILYSLGNFLFPGFRRTDGLRFHFPRSSRRTVAIMCHVNDDGVEQHEVFPLRVTSSYRVIPCRGLRRVREEAKMRRLSENLSASGYRERWQRQHESVRRATEKYEQLLQLRLALRGLRARCRDEGGIASLRMLRPRHVRRIAHVVRRHAAGLASPLTRR